MHSQIKPALMMLLLLTLLTGLVYPLLVTVSTQLIFPRQTHGSLVLEGEKVRGSELIGQLFTQPQYFWGRPSATSPAAYNAGASSGSNQGPGNPALLEAVTARIKALREADPANQEAIPVDLVTASASGLDPHISPAAALYQVSRVAKARHLSVATVTALVTNHTEARQWGVLGEPRVNVLKLNMSLDKVR